MDTTSSHPPRDEAPHPIDPEEITLSHGAAIVYKALLRWKRLSQQKRGLPYCWPSREQIAAETAYGVRTVSRHLGELVAAGRIFVIDRHDDTPLYFFDREEWENFQSLAPTRKPRTATRAKKPRGEYSTRTDSDGGNEGGEGRQVGAGGSANVGAPRGANVGAPRGANVGAGGSANVGAGVAPTLARPCLKENQSEEERAVAAAVLYLHSEIGVHPAKTEEREPSLLVAVAAHVRERLAQPGKKPIGLGYVIACLERPGNFGFRKWLDRWYSPKEFNLAQKLARKEGQKRAQEAGQRVPITAAYQSLLETRLAWFDGLSEPVKADVLEELRRRAPPNTFLSTLPVDHPYIREQCVRLAEQLQRAGKLALPPPPNVVSLTPPGPNGESR